MDLIRKINKSLEEKERRLKRNLNDPNRNKGEVPGGR
jgi:hypothetical protein